MIINILLLAALFAASKKKFNPYAAAGGLGAIKTVLYFLSTRSLLVALGAGLIFFGLAAAMVYFLSRVDKKEEGEEHFTKYGHLKKGRFKWENIPLTISVVLIIFGELLLTFIMS
jgi:heme/copper-type cytochrome/quinol oxidase subunit 2